MSLDQPTAPRVAGTASAPPVLTKLRSVVVVRPRVYRLPPPLANSIVDTQSERLIDSLPPIPEEHLAGEPSPDSPEVGAVAAVEPATPVAPAAPATVPSSGFAVEEFDDDAQQAANTTADDVLAFFAAEDELSAQFKPRVQAAFTLARNGALHAARARFEQLLEELAQAKDASQMTDRHARALAAGLRALEEADDFAVCSSDRNVSTQSRAAGHQTPMLHESESKWTLPHEAMAMYHLYAQQKLAAAVNGEQAGSMMLFGLGKIYAQLAERDDLLQATRKSLTMYRSAFTAHDQNHLAANEAGVLLARAGRYAQAAEQLQHAARLGGASTTHRNLAYVHNKLGDARLAAEHQAIADRMAQVEMQRGQLSAERGIAWVSPEEFNRRTSAARTEAVAQRPAPAPASSGQSHTSQQAVPNTPETATKRAPQPTLWW